MKGLAATSDSLNGHLFYKPPKKPYDGMIEWCRDYPVTGTGYFQRFYPDFNDGGRGWDTGYATFQFEWEEPAILFALKFGTA